MNDTNQQESVVDDPHPEYETCPHCKHYRGTKAMIRGHRMQCGIKQKRPLRVKTTEEMQAELDAAMKEIDALKAAKTEQAKDAADESPPLARKVDRTKRVAFGVPQRRLDAPMQDGYYYRWINSDWAREPGRMQRALAGGYEKVEGVGNRVAGTNADGSPITAVYMRIPKELYDEDQALKQKEGPDKTDEAILAGTVGQQAGDQRFIPGGKINISVINRPPQ